ncbi:MAG: hypothetical protein A3H02_00790 [Candidatus Niyogibacteria bacterium RIFCSPLOWO2_12_FULL_41_13]|uniref:Uncharacterized protein n=1 Tax=Candidatus Niyogibacteria bacterium RIFCSPLOWO2_12_FULL_41_13 TaxID=1801726 RepID=A0A1G2F3Q8_9BACT|nr:MAG: hypothetical protein A3H02_00790 [Candidatus Niyogibacteria bacterium RIFCSPLOWO2_12_FULL_41_13]
MLKILIALFLFIIIISIFGDYKLETSLLLVFLIGLPAAFFHAFVIEKRNLRDILKDEESLWNWKGIFGLFIIVLIIYFLSLIF